MSRRGICHIWFRGRHISPSMPYREARSVAESSEGPTASKSDRTGRNPGMTRLVRRSSSSVWRYCVFVSCSKIKYRTIYRIFQELFNETIESMNSRIANFAFLGQHLNMHLCIFNFHITEIHDTKNKPCCDFLSILLESPTEIIRF